MIANILKKLLPTKRIISIVGAVAIAVAGIVLGMESKDVRDAICSAPVIEAAK
jgi:hypothetical protein